PRRRRRARSPRRRRPLRFREGPVEGRPDAPEEHLTPRAQATHGTLPVAITSRRPASGGTRGTGPAPAAPRSGPGPAREHDLHHPRQAPPPGTRGGTRRRVPPARPRHPAQTGTRPPAPSREHGITEDR